jgi:hypothetical protein
MYPGRVNGGTIDTGRPHCSAAVSESGDTVETKRAARRFYGYQDAIAQRCSPVLTLDRETVTRLSPPRHLHEAQTVQPSPSACQFRLLLNEVSHICAETDVLAADAVQRGPDLTRLKRKEQRTGFRQSACDRSTMLASAARPTRSTRTDASVTFRPLILTPAQRFSRS